MKYMMFVCIDPEPDTDPAPEPDVEAWVAGARDAIEHLLSVERGSARLAP